MEAHVLFNTVLAFLQKMVPFSSRNGERTRESRCWAALYCFTECFLVDYEVALVGPR